MSQSSEPAYAKVNLALHVRERLDDGFHRIETIFAFCEDGDMLFAEDSATSSFEISGEFGAGLPSSGNLALQAADALREASGMDRAAALHLSKRLPVASGLGGGSADAAAVLRLLNRIWDLRMPSEQLEEIGRGLGADVAACVRSGTARGSNRGEELEEVEFDVAGQPILLVNPRVELSTSEVFARWDGYDRGPLDGWKHGRNDLEAIATSMVPQIGSILAWLSAQQGANCVRMSGSGSTCFALFESEADRDRAEMGVPREWWRLATRLR